MIQDNFLPDGFRELITDSLGRQIADVLLPALNSEPDTAIRINHYKSPLFQLYGNTTEVGWCDSARYLGERPRFTSNPLLHAGVFYVQDASSTVYETIAGSLTGDTPVRVADLCAAPGGKTTAILNALPEGSVLLANEFVASRAAILKENLCKYGYPDVVVTNTDTGKLSAMGGYFDIVALDAPCSGEGMMRKEEIARSQWSEGLIRQCASLQREIIDNAVKMLAPGGYLIYSTCTFNTQENEDNAEYIADAYGLTPVDLGLAGKFGIHSQVKGDIPCLRFMPGFTRGEGLFVAVFKNPKQNAQSAMRNMRHPKPKKNKKTDRKETGKTDAAILSEAKSWIADDFEIRTHNNTISALSPGTAALLDRIPSDVRIISAGLELGEVKGRDLVPSHSLALSILQGMPFPEVELTVEEALRYLSRESITLPSDTPRGFVVVSFRGYRLGFVKNIGNRCNNLYPSDYRIRNL
ncbi:MAG: RsmB/NOP family class I SAM-dependent RNA methyltransferase [Muribaculum sp.]|nr:RsmB/NOP family class I SAM-dependent RNA methyltransferase [Muribaculum sp.]